MELIKEQQVAQDYKAAMDSVALLEAGKPAEMTDAEWADVVARNKAHLEIQIAKGAEYYGELDLSPFVEAVK